MPRLPPCRPALDHRCWALWPTRWRTCHTSWRWQPASLHDSAAIPVYNVKWNEEMPSFLFQRSKFDKFYIEHWNFGQILEHFPFSSDVVDGADDDHMLELVIVKIRGSERHDQISQSDQRRVGISKETNDYVTIQHRHGSLITILKRQSDGISRGGEEKELSNFFFFIFSFPLIYCTSMQSSRERAGDQWNMPVESYFISVFSKSKSRAWSSAIPAWIPPLLCDPLPADPRLVGLHQQIRHRYYYLQGK